jgi:hypothetical protein
MRDRIEAELAEARASLRAHTASWEYAFAMAGGCHGGGDHPAHRATRARTDELLRRCRDLEARLAEHVL